MKRTSGFVHRGIEAQTTKMVSRGKIRVSQLIDRNGLWPTLRRAMAALLPVGVLR